MMTQEQVDDLDRQEELARRRDAVDFARVNCELEGLTMSEEHRALFDSYARGEISLEDLGKQVDEIYGI